MVPSAYKEQNISRLPKKSLASGILIQQQEASGLPEGA
jgi:hypothetical protein